MSNTFATKRESTATTAISPSTVQSTPQQIIARGTDWRFLNELKRELKA
jgi:hypothetical protein